jgi:hypothetical protein
MRWSVCCNGQGWQPQVWSSWYSAYVCLAVFFVACRRRGIANSRFVRIASASSNEVYVYDEVCGVRRYLAWRSPSVPDTLSVSCIVSLAVVLRSGRITSYRRFSGRPCPANCLDLPFVRSLSGDYPITSRCFRVTCGTASSAVVVTSPTRSEPKAHPVGA